MRKEKNKRLFCVRRKGMQKGIRQTKGEKVFLFLFV